MLLDWVVHFILDTEEIYCVTKYAQSLIPSVTVTPFHIFTPK